MKKLLFLLTLTLSAIAHSNAQEKSVMTEEMFYKQQFESVINHSIKEQLGKELYKAVEANDKKEVELLLKLGADPNYNRNGELNIRSVLTIAVTNENLEIVKLLVANKADIHWRDFFGITAVIYAAGLGNMDIVKFLIANGASIHDVDKSGITVLGAAKQSKNEKLIAYIEKALKKSH